MLEVRIIDKSSMNTFSKALPSTQKTAGQFPVPPSSK